MPEMYFTEFHRHIKDRGYRYTPGNPEALLNQAFISSFIASSNILNACYSAGTE